MGALHLPAAPLTLSCSSMRGVLYPLDTGAGARCLLWGRMGGNGRKCVVNPNLSTRASSLQGFGPAHVPRRDHDVVAGHAEGPQDPCTEPQSR